MWAAILSALAGLVEGIVKAFRDDPMAEAEQAGAAKGAVAADDADRQKLRDAMAARDAAGRVQPPAVGDGGLPNDGFRRD